MNQNQSIPPSNDYAAWQLLDLRTQLSELRTELKEAQKENRELTRERDQLKVQVNTADKHKEFALKELMAELNVEKGKTLQGALEGLGGKDAVVEILGMVKEMIPQRPAVATISQLPATALNLESIDPQRRAFFKSLLYQVKHMDGTEYGEFLGVVDTMLQDADYRHNAYIALQGTAEDPGADANQQ